jgi:protein-L-isoaspartate(D-aspartate) O-methyltransferase
VPLADAAEAEARHEVKRDRPRALLIWPGSLFGGGGNFGVPQLLAMAAAMKVHADCDVIDLDTERAFGRVDLSALVARGPYDLIGVACYSSYDYLKVVELGKLLRALAPKAWLVTGGYHASARPNDFEGTAFDYVVVGDGEGPLARLAEALSTGKRPLLQVLGPEAVADPGKMPPVDWSLLQRYRPVARKVASQAEIYLSRGCPYDCAFCMERAKRDTSWRALEPLQAVEEMHRLDAFLDLSDWTLFIADALFGMKVSWRRTFLEALAKRPIRARKVWLLVRIDLLEREDLALMARANVAPGFGLESGDPDMVRRIRKVGRLSDYLDQMMRVAGWARELDVAWGANVIVGHPGETEQSIRTTVRYLEKLYLGPGGTTGFLSVDPFRLYPGSPIDEEFADWQASTGVRVKRYPWWHDGDQDFLSEWVDPSSTLTFREAHRLRYQLFGPLLRAIPDAFKYGGPAPDYFKRALDEQIELHSPANEARQLGLDRLWSALLDQPSDDADFTRASRAARTSIIGGDDAIATALIEVPRERFVPIEAAPEAHRDVALALDDSGRSTISAMHAYAATFRALELTAGDDLVDLGGGTGYGAALAVRMGARVMTIELDAALSSRAKELLGNSAEVICADAHAVEHWRGATKVAVGFDVGEIPSEWLDALAPGGRMVVPSNNRLVVVDKSIESAVTRRELGSVRYVRDRSPREVDAAE